MSNRWERRARNSRRAVPRFLSRRLRRPTRKCPSVRQHKQAREPRCRRVRERRCMRAPVCPRSQGAAFPDSLVLLKQIGRSRNFNRSGRHLAEVLQFIRPWLVPDRKGQFRARRIEVSRSQRGQWERLLGDPPLRAPQCRVRVSRCRPTAHDLRLRLCRSVRPPRHLRWRLQFLRRHKRVHRSLQRMW